MRLLLDEMLDPTIAAELRKRGHDVAAVRGDPRLQGLPDVELIEAARRAGAALVTDNASDFARLHRNIAAAGREHAGIILASPNQFPRAKRTAGLWVDALDRLVVEHGDEALSGRCIWLARGTT